MLAHKRMDEIKAASSNRRLLKCQRKRRFRIGGGLASLVILGVVLASLAWQIIKMTGWAE